ncbi:hypothetical protein [Actinoplanes philippinensis]|uniref:hypothetical protein n=1 Tax=Actinoplanes philippinensis TaxID=35752 RepID=UPI0033EEAEDD
MSDDCLRLIPTDRQWQPDPAAAAAAADYVTRLFCGPSDHVEEVETEFYDHVTLIDAGENTTAITCPHCGGDIDAGWLADLVEENGVTFTSLDRQVPCCATTVALDSLRYDWPVGFARFEICVTNPVRARYELGTAELAAVAALLGHPVTQILAHY